MVHRSVITPGGKDSWYAYLICIDVGVWWDDRTRRIVHTLAHHVLAKQTLLLLQELKATEEWQEFSMELPSGQTGKHSIQIIDFTACGGESAVGKLQS